MTNEEARAIRNSFLEFDNPKKIMRLMEYPYDEKISHNANCIEFITYMIPIVIALFVKNSYRYDYFLILLIAIGVCISFSEKTLEYKIFSNKS